MPWCSVLPDTSNMDWREPRSSYHIPGMFKGTPCFSTRYETRKAATAGPWIWDNFRIINSSEGYVRAIWPVPGIQQFHVNPYFSGVLFHAQWFGLITRIGLCLDVQGNVWRYRLSHLPPWTHPRGSCFGRTTRHSPLHRCNRKRTISAQLPATNLQGRAQAGGSLPLRHLNPLGRIQAPGRRTRCQWPGIMQEKQLKPLCPSLFCFCCCWAVIATPVGRKDVGCK